LLYIGIFWTVSQKRVAMIATVYGETALLFVHDARASVPHTVATIVTASYWKRAERARVLATGFNEDWRLSKRQFPFVGPDCETSCLCWNHATRATHFVRMRRPRGDPFPPLYHGSFEININCRVPAGPHRRQWSKTRDLSNQRHWLFIAYQRQKVKKSKK